MNNRPSGARQRFIGLFSSLIRQMPDSEFVFFEPEDCEVTSWFAGASNVHARRTPLPSESRTKRFLRGLRYWPEALAKERFDVFECSHMPLVKAPTGKTLLTVHDVRSLHGIEGTIASFVSKRISAWSMRSADHVVTVSHAVRREINSFYPDVPVSVIYNGLASTAFALHLPEELAEVQQAFDLPKKFLLAVGHMEPRKNYQRLVDAVALLQTRGQDIGLVIIGNDSGERPLIEARIRASGMGDRVRILSGLTDAQVRCVYLLSCLLVFPSSYEGFGIPLLEAMAAAKPIVMSDIPVFREITQDQGVYFDYNYAQSIALQIERTMSSSQEKERLIAYGLKRVEDFHFGILADQMISLYHALVNAEPRH